jgi:hypothetical protein
MLVERCELLSTLLALYEGRGHPCSSTRALELVRVLGSAVGPAAAGASNAVTSSQDATGRMLVSEHLVGFDTPAVEHMEVQQAQPSGTYCHQGTLILPA